MRQPPESGSYVADSLPDMPAVAPIQVGNNGSPGGYKFDPDQVQTVINKWQELLSDFQQDLTNVQTMQMTVQAPGAEFASGDFMAKGYDPSSRTLLEQTQRMITYVQNYIEALQKASGQIQQNEQDAVQAAARQGKDVM
ncbi:hypothetical protein FNH05_30170 [Amycolatopsis rhizosphaerae]|uniref:PE domain-containing protein n=1 Tax=Amycolatopsis rhizosphaerae TaxID=2053003 RepID=A0A558AWB3_9PSEU|nr:hypothetical protein [Amycolatopsis rhizosphaerae]TVT28533.1 hypothetical protein FNH05_30170 [Amycolatopsis rhizosphaerae]